MKPENRAAGELTSTEGTSNKAVELTEDEKLVLNLLKENSPIDLNVLKDQTGLNLSGGAFLSLGCHREIDFESMPSIKGKKKIFIAQQI